MNSVWSSLFKTYCSICLLNTFSIFIKAQEAELDELKKELQTRPTDKLVDDLRKKVKILQVIWTSLL